MLPHCPSTNPGCSLQGLVPSEHTAASAPTSQTALGTYSNFCTMEPCALKHAKDGDRDRPEIHLNRAEAIRSVQNCTRVYNEADRPAKPTLRYDRLHLVQVKVIDKGTSETEDLQ